MAAAGAPAGGAAEAVEEKTEFDVVIKDAGPKKIEVIKVIRQLTSLGLGDAKTMAETAGGKVLTQVGKDAAQDAKKKLEEAGAVIELA
jgi:large subunit ribosomal protein L7/L12